MKVQSVWPGGEVELPEYDLPREPFCNGACSMKAPPLPMASPKDIGFAGGRRVKELSWWPEYLARIKGERVTRSCSADR